MSYLSQTPYRRQQQPQKSGRLVGIAVVVVLHIGLIYALASGLARDVVQMATEPLETKIIEDVPPPPPEEPPPPPPPQFEPPPQVFVPPPEIVISQPPPPNPPMAATTNVRPPEVRPPTPAPTPAPAAPPAPPTGGKLNVKSVSKPEYPSQSIRLEEAGTTMMRLYCNEDGRISDAKVEKSSGFERLDNAWMKEAKRGRWKCEPPTVDGKTQGAWLPVVVPLTFRLEDAR
ncbi:MULTISPECIES: energy transducer TonB [unclassified Azospirillum]|uniref:energy transducer TonB n=1 Tax=unclassified Azospirillum TaxID=2630922 RepID=UPI000B627AEC|nr:MULTISPECIES: energy transducer TonB [unclassified Azospirillum]SNR93347.1 outer membrane transport energization protein TonB [Azospirillum sp. RU38E]SNS09278.1 outer membrane transport energization protein TonB [Azospirillum sp. RU37A]